MGLWEMEFKEKSQYSRRDPSGGEWGEPREPDLRHFLVLFTDEEMSEIKT